MVLPSFTLPPELVTIGKGLKLASRALQMTAALNIALYIKDSMADDCFSDQDFLDNDLTEEYTRIANQFFIVIEKLVCEVTILSAHFVISNTIFESLSVQGVVFPLLCSSAGNPVHRGE